MVANDPHYLLFCESNLSEAAFNTDAERGGRWHFVLEQLGGGRALEAADFESAATSDRLALLSVVRGLEALEQPSNVTLVTTSRYVNRGLRFGLNSWRENEYQWERFGVRMPVRNADLWRRIDTAMHFHGVTCRLINSQDTQRKPELQSPTVIQARPEVESADLKLVQPEFVATHAEKIVAPAAEHAKPVVSVTLPIATAGLRQSKSGLRHGIGLGRFILFQEFWWKLAQHWIKWWRGRFQFKPAFYGT